MAFEVKWHCGLCGKNFKDRGSASAHFRKKHVKDYAFSAAIYTTLE